MAPLPERWGDLPEVTPGKRGGSCVSFYLIALLSDRTQHYLPPGFRICFYRWRNRGPEQRGNLLQVTQLGNARGTGWPPSPGLWPSVRAGWALGPQVKPRVEEHWSWKLRANVPGWLSGSWPSVPLGCLSPAGPCFWRSVTTLAISKPPSCLSLLLQHSIIILVRLNLKATRFFININLNVKC